MKIEIILMTIYGLIAIVSIVGNIYLTILALKALR